MSLKPDGKRTWDKPKNQGAQMDLLSGRQQRDAGLDSVETNAIFFVEHLRTIAEWHCRRHGSVTINDLRRYADEEGMRPHHPNAWGSILRAPRFIAIGFDQAEQPSSHARRIVRWALAPGKE